MFCKEHFPKRILERKFCNPDSFIVGVVVVRPDTCPFIIPIFIFLQANKSTLQNKRGFKNVFKTKRDLKNHQTEACTLKPFPCDRCGKGYERIEHLQRHKATHTALVLEALSIAR